MIDSSFSCDVAAAKAANDEITLMDSSLEIAGIEIIKEIELQFHIFDSDTWDGIIDSDKIIITTSADSSFIQSYDDSGFKALDRDGIKLVIKKVDSDDSFWGADIYVYIENNTDANVTIQARDVSINGFMVDPYFSCDVVSGKKAYDTITFMESDLTDNNIEIINNMDLSFNIFNTDSFDTIFDSDIITVNFE